MDRSFRGFTVADILARSGKRHIGLLKVDIKGSEERLFSSGYADWIDQVKNIVIELHGPSWLGTVFAVVKGYRFAVSRSGEYVIFTREQPQGKAPDAPRANRADTCSASLLLSRFIRGYNPAKVRISSKP